MQGWISLHRKLLEWEWYSDTNTKCLFIHCLLKANHREKKWNGITVERGQFITGRDKLAQELHMSVRQVRTALDKLKSTNEITIKSTNKYSVITVVNYSEYQDRATKSDQQNDQQATSKRPANDQQTTTTNNVNNNNNENKEIYSAFFENIWKLYPLKKGKSRISDTKKKELHKIGYDKLKACIERYKIYVDSQDWLRYQNGSTFFNSGYVDYLDENYEKVKPSEPSNKFINYNQRNYDFDHLEKRALEMRLNKTKENDDENN